MDTCIEPTTTEQGELDTCIEPTTIAASSELLNSLPSMTFFKKFFLNIHDSDPDEDDVDSCCKGKPKKPKFYGTISPYPDFSASSDASDLQKAIEAKGVDEDVIISLLVKRSNEQRQRIKAVYKESTEKALADDLKSVLRSDLEDVVLALLMTPTLFDAHCLRKATKGLGTHESVLVEILASRSNHDIHEIKRVFQEEYQEELEDIIKGDTSGDFTLALQALLKANKDEDSKVDLDLAKMDAKALFAAAENGKAIDINAFLDILTFRSGPQLRKTFQKYASLSENTLSKDLGKELKGDIADCLIDIVKCAWNKPGFFAEKLHLSMKGLGTCDETLIRVMVSRSEVDLKKVMDEYKTMFGRTLQEDILADTKGHYETILLELCGPV